MKKDKEWLLTELRNIDTTDNNNEFVFGYETAIDLALDLADQLEEPEKIVVPQFIDDWFKTRKKEFSTITAAIGFLKDYGWDNETHIDYMAWEFMNCNGDTFARAWLNGYEVEKEPLYYAKSKVSTLFNWDNDGEDYFATLDEENDTTVFLFERYDNGGLTKTMTEWNQLGINDTIAIFEPVEVAE